MKKTLIPIAILCMLAVLVTACDPKPTDVISNDTSAGASVESTGQVSEEQSQDESTEVSQDVSEVSETGSGETSGEASVAESQDSQAQTSSQPQSQTSTGTVSTVPAPTLPATSKVDLKNAKFPNTTLKRIVWYTLGQDEKDMLAAFKTKTGVTVTDVSSSFAEINDKISASILAKDPIDIGWIYGAFNPQVLIQNLYQPINNYISNDYLVNTSKLTDGGFDLSKMQNFVWKGNYYGFCSYYDVDMIVLYFNKKMFSDMGVKNPLQHVASNTWNWDTFRSVGVEMTDVDSGIYGLAGGSHEGIWLLAAGAQIIKYSTSGVPSENLSDPKILEAFNFIRGMYGNGATQFALAESNPMGMFETGRAAMFVGGLYDAPKIKTSSTALTSVKNNLDYAPIPLSKNNSAKKYPTDWLKATAITKGSTKADAVAAYAYFRSKYKGDNLYDEYFDADQKSRNEPYYKNILPANQSFGEINVTLGQILARISGGSDPAQEISEYKPIFKNEIDKVLANK
ncbi:MAG: extracellular solute-binding protein [Eubacteriales bacterium]|nr:extracellular solute-binding protein [Eubacteriales bacterium]